MKKLILILTMCGVCFAGNFQRSSDTTRVCNPSKEDGFCVSESGWKYHKVEKQTYKYPGYVGSRWNTSGSAYDPQMETFKPKRYTGEVYTKKNCNPSSAFARCD